MNETVRIVPPSDHREWLPMLVEWLQHEWRGWYGQDGSGDSPRELADAAQRERLPVAVIALWSPTITHDGAPLFVYRKTT